MQARRFATALSLFGAAVAQAQTGGTATYSIAFGSPGGPNSIGPLPPGTVIDVFVNVAWTTGGTPPPIGLADGAFSITGNGGGATPGTWGVNTNSGSPTYSLPNPWGGQNIGGLGVSVGTPSGTSINGVIWGMGFLLTQPHPFPQNPANVWRGTFTMGTPTSSIVLNITQMGATSVFTGGPGIPGVAMFNSVGGNGIIFIPGPGVLALLVPACAAAARRRR